MTNLYARTRFLTLSLIILLVVSLVGCQKAPEGVVAIVNGEEIREEDFDAEFEIYRETYSRELGEDALSQVREDGTSLEDQIKLITIDTLIVERLILQDANEKGIAVTDQDVDERIEELTEAMGGEEELDKFLEDYSLNRDFFTDHIRRALILERHNQEYIDGLDINKDEAREFFETNKENLIVLRGSHILLKTEEDARKILERLEDGEKFEDLAIEESEDSVSALDGGDLGYIIPGSYTGFEEIEDALLELEVGSISDLVETEAGFHIVRLDERKDTFEKLEEDILELLKNQKYRSFVEDLRDDGKIKVYLDINK